MGNLMRRKKALAGHVKKLRPVVRCPGQRHNVRLRLGRGFSYEVVGARLSVPTSKKLRIVYDPRRVNRNEEGYQLNLKRLKEYIQTITRVNNKGKKRIDFEKMRAGANIMPIEHPPKETGKEVEMTAEMLAFEAAAALREAWLATRKKKKEPDEKGKNKKK